jgi:CubicO group peptidase (beta-lactamase class C family)
LSPAQAPAIEIPAGQIGAAVAALDGLAHALLTRTGVPGMAVAVVHGGETAYARGFGVRTVGGAEVDADTVFQLASVSKSVGATVVAHEVARRSVTWETAVASKLPQFTLADPYVTAHVTIGDLYAHRSGLPEHAGDDLEDLGYDRAQVLERLRYLPLDPFRSSYHYTNFGVTAAAEAVAAAARVDWATLSEQVLYTPLGMSSTSSRFADFEARENRARGHQLVGGAYVARDVRQPDAQSPAGGVSSSVNDMARWLTMLLDNGHHLGAPVVDPAALLPAISPQSVSAPPDTDDSRAGFYGFGFDVGTSAAGRVTLSHSGAFALGAATNFVAIPSADVAIVALTNAAPIGVPEALTAQFADLVQFGEVRQDWARLYQDAFAGMSAPKGSLVGQERPADPAPPRPLTDYVGTYANRYYGAAHIADHGGGELVLTLGPAGQTYPLAHWDGDVFTFPLSGENAPDGTISKATFAGNVVLLEYFDSEGQGTFTR